jgi:hypothetical protein
MKFSQASKSTRHFENFEAPPGRPHPHGATAVPCTAGAAAVGALRLGKLRGAWKGGSTGSTGAGEPKVPGQGVRTTSRDLPWYRSD